MNASENIESRLNTSRYSGQHSTTKVIVVMMIAILLLIANSVVTVSPF
jgi:hypothetical protein